MGNNNPDAPAGAYRQPDDPGAVRVPFGKHAGKTLRRLLVEAPGYYRWLRKSAYSPRLKEAIGKYSETEEARKAMRGSRGGRSRKSGTVTRKALDGWAMR